MKLLHPVLLLISIMSSSAAMGQTIRPSSEAATAEQRLAEDLGLERLPDNAIIPTPANGRNVSTLQQNGRDNTAAINQQTLSSLGNQAYVTQAGEYNGLSLMQMGGGNIANVTQNGNNNNAEYTQNGQGNSSTITQKGRNNRIQGLSAESEFQLQGDYNTMKITQEGSNNTVKGEIRENSRVYDIRQNGNNNTLTQIETSPQAPKGYTVEMKGSGINLTIQQGRVGQ
ncbi:hypothetical protein ACFST9_11980 [Hymenobacter monticola]|uniref:Curlin n=1 Tax=Hymenobacter monticola TaxID=1705399 RepID=A0ABY4B7H9_9BACT|nr:hypothetical protein [Hymenobacter monticola]UOE35088.1 hypothetical protein MTP16_05430 [Hymenobacter monticola]